VIYQDQRRVKSWGPDLSVLRLGARTSCPPTVYCGLRPRSRRLGLHAWLLIWRRSGQNVRAPSL